MAKTLTDIIQFNYKHFEDGYDQADAITGDTLEGLIDTLQAAIIGRWSGDNVAYIAGRIKHHLEKI